MREYGGFILSLGITVEQIETRNALTLTPISDTVEWSAEMGAYKTNYDCHI
jgi:hypothetical protein